MSDRFLAVVEAGITKLKSRRQKLEDRLDQVHICNCEFCTHKGGRVKSRRIQKQIEEVDQELEILERYVREYRPLDK